MNSKKYNKELELLRHSVDITEKNKNVNGYKIQKLPKL